jgi:ribosomal protein S18 acetylase RimI-like enzyme
VFSRGLFRSPGRVPAGATLPGAVVDRVAVLPECRGAGHGQRLV